MKKRISPRLFAIFLLLALLPALSFAEGNVGEVVGSDRSAHARGDGPFERILTYAMADGSQLVLEYDADAPFKTDGLSATLEQMRLCLEAIIEVSGPAAQSVAMSFEFSNIPVRITCVGWQNTGNADSVDHVVGDKIFNFYQATFDI